MTTTSATGSTSSTAATTSSAPTALSTLSGNYTDFLKLLMTQLQNQDPTAPMDTNQFTSQLVQFSSVEQQINTNTSLNTLIQATQSNNLLQSSALVGQTVDVKSDQLSLQNGSATIKFDTAAPQGVAIGIYNQAGIKVQDATLTSTAGTNTWTWNGQTANGATLPDGPYKVVVNGTGGGAVPFTVEGTATGIQRSGSTVNVQLGKLAVSLDTVQSATR